MSLKFLFLLFLFFDKQMGLKVDNNPLSGMKDDSADENWYPNVQEWVKWEHLVDVPEIFIRNDTDMENDKPLLHGFSSDLIPIIDFAMLKSGRKDELLKLDKACKDWGFFQLKNGVPTEVLQDMKDASADFFNLPLEEKKIYAMPKMNMEGYGHVQVENPENKLDWLDALLLLTQPTEHRNYSYWPQTPSKYKDILEKYSSEVTRVGVELLNYLSQIVGKPNPIVPGLSPVYFEVNYYPPCSKPDQVLNMSPHFDSNSLTLVMQDQDDVDELEILHDGGWVLVTPRSNVLIINIGDSIKEWSDERYKSVRHRVVANKTKVRSLHEIILLPYTNTSDHNMYNSDGGFVNFRRGSTN